jgi:hypothetical protein
MPERTARSAVPPLLAGALAAVLLGAASCGANAAAQALLAAPLRALPDDGPAWTRQVSAQSDFPGGETFSTSGQPYVHPDATHPEWLVLDATGLPLTGAQFVWAIWQIPLTSETVIEELRVNTQSSVSKKYYPALANYALGHWVIGPESHDTITLALPPDQAELHSPGQYCYIAIIVMAGQKITVASFGMTASGGASAPIFDQYEPNDPMESAYPLDPYPLDRGYYHASIHETYVPEMGGRDKMDFYTVHLEAGQFLTATLKHEPYDHFWVYSDADPLPNYNDLDVLLYPPNSTQPYDQFIEPPVSGMTIYYYAADQAFYQVPAGLGGDYIIGILGDVSGPDNNAEYYLDIFISDAVHTVSGYLTQKHEAPDKPFLAFLESSDPQDPGFFNCIAPVDQSPHGHIQIFGVPDGDYTLKIQSSAAFFPYPVHPYVWEQTLPVIVAGMDVTDASLDIGDDP